MPSDNPAAFPVTGCYSEQHNDWHQQPETGMDLRDYFAGQTLTGLGSDCAGNPKMIAEYVYRVAQAMLDKRQRLLAADAEAAEAERRQRLKQKEQVDAAGN